MFRLTCPKCGAEPCEAWLEVMSGRFRASNMWLQEDGFAAMDAKSFDTDEETVYCHKCKRWFSLGDCLEENGPAPSFKPFKGFDWTELAARFGVDIKDDQKEDAAKLRTWLEHHSMRELAWVATNCREFLTALIQTDPTSNKPLWIGLAGVKDDETFMRFFTHLFEWMWT